jgi:predicted aspartyl protease
MRIALKNNCEPTVGIRTGDGEVACLVDTGFTGLLLGYLYPRASLNGHLQQLELIEPLRLLSQQQWVTVANGAKVRTWVCNARISFEESCETVDIVLIQARARQSADFILGIEFLRRFHCRLSMWFDLDHHELISGTFSSERRLRRARIANTPRDARRNNN